MVRALLVRTGSCRGWCGSVRQSTVDVQGSATAAAEAMVQAETGGDDQRRQGQLGCGRGNGAGGGSGYGSGKDWGGEKIV